MKLRVARHTTDLYSIVYFYRDLLGLELLGAFSDHQAYDGVFLGRPGDSWHLEFTVSNEPPVHHADEDDLLVFYVSKEEYPTLVEKLKRAEVSQAVSKNPYWSKRGTTFLDPDGFRVVISCY